MPSNAVSSLKYMRSLLSSDVGGSCSDKGFSIDRLSLRSVSMSPSVTQRSLSSSMS